MIDISYVNLNEINPDDLIPVLNNQKIREHLIDHELFNADSVKAWIKAKEEVDSTRGCRVRAIIYQGQLAGWCGIQLEGDNHEIAIIIDNKYWGLGKAVFHDMMCWAKELGHREILIHLLHTRPGYKFLRSIANNVYESEVFGNRFLTYELPVK